MISRGRGIGGKTVDSWDIHGKCVGHSYLTMKYLESMGYDNNYRMYGKYLFIEMESHNTCTGCVGVA